MARMTRVERSTPDTWKAVLQDFLFWKQAHGVSPRTLKDYRQHVTRFFTEFGDAFDEGCLRARVLGQKRPGVAPAFRIVFAAGASPSGEESINETLLTLPLGNPLC